MKFRLSALLLLYPCVCVSPQAIGSPPEYLSQLAMTGTWEPKPPRTTLSPPPANPFSLDSTRKESRWELLSDRLRFTNYPHQFYEYEIVRKEPLPDGDWTIDFWTLQYDISGHEFTFFIGRRDSPNGSLELLVDADIKDAVVNVSVDYDRRQVSHGSGSGPYGAGCVHWVRIVYSRQNKRMGVFLNGHRIPWEGRDISISSGPIGFRMPSRQNDYILDIVSFQVSSIAEFPDQSLPGMAFSGWQTEPKADGLRSIPDLPSRPDSYAKPDPSDMSNAYALAGMVLFEKALTKRIGSALWTRITGFVQASLDTNRNAASVLLPIAIACASDEQRSEAQAWVQEFFDMRHLDWPKYKVTGDSVFLQRAALLDPQSAAMMAMDGYPSLALTRSLQAELRNTAPGEALAITIAAMSRDAGNPKAAAWMLPDLLAVSPNYANLTMEYLRTHAGDKPSQGGETDVGLSFAAYRLAPVDLPKSLEFTRLIRKPSVKAETLQYIAQELPGTHPDLDKEIEASFKDAIAQWQPKNPDDTPVSEMFNLAKWYQSRGRTPEAIATIEDAAQRTNSLSDERFQCELELARVIKASKQPEAEIWWKKAESSAIGRDKDASECVAGIYISAVSLMVMDLVKEDRIDEALALLDRMNPELTMNRARCLSAIIQHLSRSDLPRSLALMKDMPPGALCYSTVARVAPELAKTDLNAALALIAPLPAEQRIDAAVLISDAVGAEHLIRIYATVASEPPKDKFARAKLAALTAKLPLKALVECEPYLRNDADSFANLLLNSVAVEVGLSKDPLWKAFSRAESTEDAIIPWGPDTLHYALQQLRLNAAQVR